jgi:hypothetical protein
LRSSFLRCSAGPLVDRLVRLIDRLARLIDGLARLIVQLILSCFAAHRVGRAPGMAAKPTARGESPAAKP